MRAPRHTPPALSFVARAARAALATRVAVVAGMVMACRHAAPPSESRPGGARSASAAASEVRGGKGEVAGPARGSPGCGTVDCRIFSEPAEAFRAVLAESPLALGIGETHALRGTEAIEPPTRRFTRELLPLLAGRASDLVVELLLPNPKCGAETKAAASAQKVVTQHQASGDQSDYVALGTAAKALGIRPHALEPTCDDLARIAGIARDGGRSSDGSEGVAASLDVITRLATELGSRLVDANAAAHDPRLVVLYGGALHNDVAPRPSRAAWSFGPALSAKTSGRYVELDLIVPEFIGDSPAWRSFPWVARFDPGAHAAEARLLSPAPQGFVLVFPRTAPAPFASPAPSVSTGTSGLPAPTGE